MGGCVIACYRSDIGRTRVVERERRAELARTKMKVNRF